VNRIVRGAANRDQLFDQFVGYSADDQFRHRFNIVGQLCRLPRVSAARWERLPYHL
jgi:hypothetical protein